MVIVYALICVPTGKAYIGCTRAKLSKRMREHRCLLRAGKHAEPELQADWSKYGEPVFQMVEMEIFLYDESVETRRAAEKKWMAYFKERGLLYNQNESSFEPKPEIKELGRKLAIATIGNRWSPEANLKRSLAQKGKPKGHGAKISATKRAKQAMR